MRAIRVANLTSRSRLVGAIAICLVTAFGPGASALARQEVATAARATIGELNESGIAGVTSLVADGDTTTVTIWADGALGDHPTHIHEGSCADFDPNPQYPLTNVVLETSRLSGTSETEVEVALDDLLATPHLILIHKSEEEIGTYVGCGDIVAGAVTDEEVAAITGGEGSPLPGTGIGDFAGDTASRGLLLAMLAGGLLALATSMLTRRAGASAAAPASRRRIRD